MVIEAHADGCRLHLLVQPRASNDQVVGVQGEALKVRISAPPVEGKANAALTRLLAKRLGVSRRQVAICSGATGRRKTVAVTGLSAQQARERLGI